MSPTLPIVSPIGATPLFLPNLGMGELAIIFVIILILFGPGKLPGVMKALGDGFKQFKDASSSNSEQPPKPDKTNSQSTDSTPEAH